MADVSTRGGQGRAGIRVWMMGVAVAALLAGATGFGQVNPYENDLIRKLDQALAPGDLKATVAACVVEVPTGRVIYERSADQPMIPASNMKLLTSAAAIDILGPDYMFKTRLARKGDTLALIGGADPGFGDPTLAGRRGEEITAAYAAWIEKLAEPLAAGQIRRLVFDDTILDSELRHPNWDPDEYQRWYCAPVGGLTINDSCVNVGADVVAGRTVPFLVPPCSLFEIDNRSRVGLGDQVMVGRLRGQWRLIVSGQCAARTQPYAVTVPDPGLFAAGVLRDMLTAAGCSDLDAPQRLKVTDQAGGLLASWEVVGVAETSMADVLHRCNTNSQNLFAEALLKLAGGVATGSPGSWASGRIAVSQFLRRHDLPGEGVRVDDGSGLSRENLVTTRLLATLLCKMRRHPGWEIWRDSLAVGGDSGTLTRRFRGSLDGKVLAKTGYIRGVSSLSGYVQVGEDRYVAFAFLYNDLPASTWQAKQAQERACLALYRELREPLATQAGAGQQ